jgi:hypothetical protein
VIIQRFKIRTAYGAERLKNHVFAGVDNEEITVVRGCLADVEDAFTDARHLGRTFALLHIVLAPEQPMSLADMVAAAEMYCAEFRLEMSRAVIIDHRKPRINEAFDHHLHLLVPAYDTETGRAADDSNSFLRHEYLSRRIEWQHRHSFVAGAHTAWVIRRLRQEGLDDSATALSAAFPDDAPRPRESLTVATVQSMKRRGVNASGLRLIVRAAWRETNDAESFLTRLRGHDLTVAAGDVTPPV